jgi:hypothetical protein
MPFVVERYSDATTSSARILSHVFFVIISFLLVSLSGRIDVLSVKYNPDLYNLRKCGVTPGERRRDAGAVDHITEAEAVAN